MDTWWPLLVGGVLLAGFAVFRRWRNSDFRRELRRIDQRRKASEREAEHAERSRNALVRLADSEAAAARLAGKERKEVAMQRFRSLREIEALSDDEVIERARDVWRKGRGLIVLLALALPSVAHAAPITTQQQQESPPMRLDHPQTGEPGAWVPMSWLKTDLLLRDAFPQMQTQLRLAEVEVRHKHREAELLRGALNEGSKASAALRGALAASDRRAELLEQRERRGWIKLIGVALTSVAVGMLAGALWAK